MNQGDQNINKDMDDFDLIDVDSLDFSDDQTWLYKLPNDSGNKVDIVDWTLSLDWPDTTDRDYMQLEQKLMAILDDILKNEVQSLPDRHKFDSRTYVKPKKRTTRPSIQNIVEVPSNPPSLSSNPLNTNKYLTYNKYNTPMGGLGPILRLKTFNVDTNSENSTVVKEYAMKRRSFAEGHDDDPQLEDADVTLLGDSGRLSMEHHTPSKPISIDLSQPVHNQTFNKGLTSIINERGSLNMYQSGESLMRMSPPSLVSSLMMESSGTFNPDSMEKKSLPSHKEPAPPARDSIDPMMTSMTLSILDEKDMSTSFLSQTTYPDNDSLMDSLPPSLVSSVNSSYVVNNSKPKDPDSNIFSSATFTHLEQSEKLLSARPRCQLYNSMKRESGIRNSESYTKSREEACQIDTVKVLNGNLDKKETPKKDTMAETITIHFSDKFKDVDAEKENFVRDDAFYKENGLPVPDEGRSSLNVTLGKQELNEIIQARQKLSLARKALPSDPKASQRQEDPSPVKTIQLPNQVITVPKHSMENASELLSRRRMNGFDKEEPTARDTPKRNSTFKKLSPKQSMDATVVLKEDGQSNDIIDINSATMNLIDVGGHRTPEQQEWCSQERAMVGSCESTDTGTFSSSSPPESVPDTQHMHDTRPSISSTPLISVKKGAINDIDFNTNISPIYAAEGKNYSAKHQSVNSSTDKTYTHNATVINSATLVKKSSAKRDILGASPDRTLVPNVVTKSPTKLVHPSAVNYGGMVAPSGLVRKTGLPTSKLRQYSSHRELSRIPGASGSAVGGIPRGAAVAGSIPGRGAMVRRGVYASNPALSPTAPPADYPPADTRIYKQKSEENPSRPTLMNPPALVRQGTETLRRERPQSQLIAPKDVRGAAGGVTHRQQHIPAPATRPYSIAGASQLRVTRPASGPAHRPIPAPTVVDQPRPASNPEHRSSGLPRPSRLPAPRRALRPPSVYSVAPADAENY